MTQPEAKEKYVFTFMKDENGKDILYRFILTLSKKFSEGEGEDSIEHRLRKVFATINGLDGMSGVGRYTVEISVARTFDAEEVIAELKRRLETEVLTDIIQPGLVTP
jgi:hypothetical protein